MQQENEPHQEDKEPAARESRGPVVRAGREPKAAAAAPDRDAQDAKSDLLVLLEEPESKDNGDMYGWGPKSRRFTANSAPEGMSNKDFREQLYQEDIKAGKSISKKNVFGKLRNFSIYNKSFDWV
jgi:hypothetical protein